MLLLLLVLCVCLLFFFTSNSRFHFFSLLLFFQSWKINYSYSNFRSKWISDQNWLSVISCSSCWPEIKTSLVWYKVDIWSTDILKVVLWKILINNFVNFRKHFNLCLYIYSRFREEEKQSKNTKQSQTRKITVFWLNLAGKSLQTELSSFLIPSSLCPQVDSISLFVFVFFYRKVFYIFVFYFYLLFVYLFMH